jgi:PAS domain S-box-containing protein
MAPKHSSKLLSLPIQGVILIIVIVIVTAAAIGVPAILLIRGQLDRQAWELASQGSQMALVLLDARDSELSNLAILTAQRPTLSELLGRGDAEGLAGYLETLRAGAGLDLVMICGSQGEMDAQVGLEIPPEACRTASTNKFYRSEADLEAPVWQLAYQPITEDPTHNVVVGQAFDRDFSDHLKAQIGMEHLLLFNGELIGGSFPDNNQIWEAFRSQPSTPSASASQNASSDLSLEGVDYYSVRSRLENTGLEIIVLLPGTAIAETQRRLTLTAGGGILIVTLFCSLAAILLTRRISRPLERLRDSANALRMGDLASPVKTSTKVREIAEVTYALEDARIALQHSLEELRQEKAWVDYLLESVVEGIFTFDRQGRVTSFSRGAERITSLKQEQVLGKSVDEVFVLADRASRFSQRIPAPSAKPEILTILVNERALTLEVAGARLAPPEAGKANQAVSIRDISNEQAMRGLLGDFLSNITHEFRTPLTAQAVSIELLLDQLPELSQEEIRELLVSNHLGVLSLQNLIDNLLEGASIEAGRFQVSPRPTDLAEVIHEVAGMMRPLMDKNRHCLQLEVPVDLPLVQADPRRTSQVLVNLLSNAVKWGPQGSDIFLSVVTVADEVRISVADQGPGVLPEQKHRLFTRFGHMQPNNNRAEYSAGLGLSVVKAIVESQKGRVGVEDRQGGGAIFWFTIPSVAVFSSQEEEDL